MHAFKEQCLQESGCLKLCLFLLHTSGQFASVKLIHKWPVTSSSLSFWRWRSICHHPPIHRPNLSCTSTQKAFFCPKPTMKIKEHRRLSPETISTWSIRRGSTACTQARTYSSAAEIHVHQQSSAALPRRSHGQPECKEGKGPAWASQAWDQQILNKDVKQPSVTNPRLLAIRFPWITKSQPTPKLFKAFLMLVALEAMDQLRQSGPHSEMQPGWSIKHANKAVLR